MAITGAYAFICKTTQSKQRPIRFIILEAVSSLGELIVLCLIVLFIEQFLFGFLMLIIRFDFIAIPAANFLSGKLLSQTPWIYGQYRNYIGVFLVSGSILTFTEFWILITLLTGRSNSRSSYNGQSSSRQSRAMSQVSAYSYYKSLQDPNARRVTAFSLQVPGPSNRRGSSISHLTGGARRTSVATLLMGFSMMNKSPNGQQYGNSMGTLSEDGLDTRRTSAVISPNGKRNSTSSTDFTFGQVINYRNAIMACKSFIRPRVNYGRPQMICLTISMIFTFFTINSSSVIDESYTNQLFNWTQLQLHQISDVKSIVISLTSVLIMIIMVHLLSLRDITITAIGLVSILLSLLLKGLIFHPIVYYLSSTIEILFGLTLAGFRSMVTSIVYSYEISKIFTIIASFMTITRPLVILIFSKLASSTLQSKANHLFLYCCSLLIPPVVTIFTIYLIEKKNTNQKSQTRKSLCTVQVTPSPLPSPSTNVFELSITKENVRRKSSRF